MLTHDDSETGENVDVPAHLHLSHSSVTSTSRNVLRVILCCWARVKEADALCKAGVIITSMRKASSSASLFVNVRCGEGRWLRDGVIGHVLWRDNKVICISSTFHNTTGNETVERKQKTGMDDSSEWQHPYHLLMSRARTISWICRLIDWCKAVDYNSCGQISRRACAICPSCSRWLRALVVLVVLVALKGRLFVGNTLKKFWIVKVIVRNRQV